MVVSCMVIGHSYVRRLHSYVSARGIRNLYLVPSQCDVEFISSHVSLVQDLVAANVLGEVARFKPDCVVLDIGTNDIDNGWVSSRRLAYRVVSWAEHLIEAYDVRCVFVCQIFPRFRGQYSARRRGFNEQVEVYNDYAERFCRQGSEELREPRLVKFWRHPNMQLQIESLIADGVHLNEWGMYK